MGRTKYRRRDPGDGEPLINLTPLIDVVFVILIAFIVIAPLLEREQVELAEASVVQKGPSITDSSLISLHVSNENVISLNGRRLEEFDLIPQLAEAHHAYPAAVPQLFHDKNARFGTYQKVKNAAQSAGFPMIEVILEPQ